MLKPKKEKKKKKKKDEDNDRLELKKIFNYINLSNGFIFLYPFNCLLGVDIYVDIIIQH